MYWCKLVYNHLLEAIHDYPDEALGLFFFLIVIVWLLSGVFEKNG